MNYGIAGQAVEFYTTGGYATRDIDLVALEAARSLCLNAAGNENT